MSAVEDYIQRLRKLALDLMPNVTQGRRPVLTRLNSLTQQPLLNGPIMTAIRNGAQTGPLRQMLSKPVISGVTNNFGSRLQGIANAVSETNTTQPIAQKETLEVRNANNVQNEVQPAPATQVKKNEKKMRVI
jgi:hypothetical protein